MSAVKWLRTFLGFFDKFRAAFGAAYTDFPFFARNAQRLPTGWAMVIFIMAVLFPSLGGMTHPRPNWPPYF